MEVCRSPNLQTHHTYIATETIPSAFTNLRNVTLMQPVGESKFNTFCVIADDFRQVFGELQIVDMRGTLVNSNVT